MPHRPNTPCKHPGCARLVPYGTMYCEEHKALHPETTRPAGKRGYGSRWRRESKAFLQAHPLCVRCLASGKYVRATVVDQSFPIAVTRNCSGIGAIGNRSASTAMIPRP